MEDQVRRIRTSVEALLEEKAALQQMVSTLQQQNAELIKTLESKEVALKAATIQMEKDAITSTKSEAELKTLREQINAYIKEIDQCIATLQGA